jgi:signal transduction histidine kinase
VNLPTNKDFATEVRSDRLKMLSQFTMVGSAALFWITSMASMFQRANAAGWLVALALLTLVCVATRSLVIRDRYLDGVWTFAIGSIVAVSVVLAWADPQTVEIVAFLFPIIVFVVGLLVSPAQTLLIAGLSSLALILVPSFNQGMLGAGVHQIVAVCLTFLSAVLAAQVTGELYQVTEWALMNYQRERKTTEALFENRQLLERALNRSNALGEELQDANTQLETARSAAEEAKHFRGQFLANMSHELRTPLNAIIGFSETMLKFPAMYDDVNLPDAYRSDLNQIYTSGRQLLSLINDILDLSKVDAGKLELHIQRVSLENILDMVISTAQGLIGERPIKLERDYTMPLPTVKADESRVRQVLLNLYSNATKFTEKGAITLVVRKEDAGVRISVKDTGKGIAPQFHESIFEEFKQADPNGRDPRSGAGLGLAISRHLLGLMEGRIWVESEVGKGSTFHFILPSYEGDDTQPTRVPAFIEQPEQEKVV